MHIYTGAAKAENEVVRSLVGAVDGVLELTDLAAVSPPHRREQPVEIDDIDASRSQEYSLIAMLLMRSPDAAMLGRLAKLRGNTTKLGLAHSTLARAAGNANVERIAREYFTLFIGVGRSELMPYASFYLTGFLNERPLSRLRGDMATLGIERVENNSEPEDHAATLCEIMAGLAAGRFHAPADAQHQMFEKHIAPWMGRLFIDMENAEAANFYRSVGSLGRLFLEIEAEAFTLAN
jgi:TorA maturation chaperone TorD